MALVKAKTHGAKFTATQGGHVTTNDMFKSTEMDVREKEIKAMEKDKEVRSKLENFEGRATEALMRVGCDYVKLKGTELVDILRWHQIPSNEIGGVAANYKKWLELCGEDPPTYLKWSDIDEAQLAELTGRLISPTLH